MKSLFSAITRLSLRFRIVTLVLVVVFLALGVIAITQLQLELVPSVAFPQTIILSQVSGLTSDEVLNVLTKRMEDALSGIPKIVNLESTTTGAFGSVIIARNNFGDNQERLQDEIRAALDTVWLPQRHIRPAEGEDGRTFAAALLAEMTPDVLIYLQEKDANFLFQLLPDVWAALPDETVTTVLAYLAAQLKEQDSDQGALRQLIDQEIVPQLEAMEVVASVNVSGGQILPGEGEVQAVETAAAEPTSLLRQLAPEVWIVAREKAGLTGDLNAEAEAALASQAFEIPSGIPPLPPSWQMDRFRTAQDLFEMRTLTRSIAAALNNFTETGRISGALGQTDDLTPDDIRKMLEIQPSMVNYFEAEHLVAMSPEVFAALPDDYIASLDGFTRDELAAKALAASITGQDTQPAPINLPNPWRIAPPSLVSFSFDDIPLASFSVSSTGEATRIAQNPLDSETPATAPTPEATSVPDAAAPAQDIPEGPALPPFFNVLGLAFGVQINTADDLINLQLPEAAAQQFGGGSLRAADLLNFLMLLRDPSSLPPGVSLPALVQNINPVGIIGQMSADAVAFLDEYDPTFLPALSPDVYDAFSDDVLRLDQAAPPLSDVWNALAGQPQFKDQPLRTAADILRIGKGQASAVLNTINQTVPERFAGYEVRLFDSLTTGVVRYFALRESDFFTNLDRDMLTKLSPAVLTLLPDDVLNTLDESTAASVRAIAAGTQESAAQALASLYTLNVPPADPNAPPINPDWGVVANFLSIELDSADDFFRFPDRTGTPTAFINGLFDSAQGIAFAPSLLGGLSSEALFYINSREATFLDNLRVEALQLLAPDVLAALPQAVQDRALAGGEPFKPTSSVTRANGSNSLLVTVYKTRGTNTVAAFHEVERKLEEIAAEDPTIEINTAFEQASFIEESISGVAREGGLGGVFAVVVILIFLSNGLWMRSRRRIVGIVLAAVFFGALLLLVFGSINADAPDFGAAFEQVDVVVRVMLILGIVVGLLIVIWPGDLPQPAWRSTLVVGISIPLSLAMALAVMNWIPPFVHNLLAPLAETSPIFGFFIRLFPSSVTINILTLSGLTVAVGRVVDDSIVVLENIFREIQSGGDRRQAIINGTRDVSVAIFAATVITVVVFLPLGLTGGIISEFFLPFGLTVTYALMSSFVVAITVVPVLAFLFIDPSEAGSEEHTGLPERLYAPVLRWALANNVNRILVLALALGSMIFGFALFGSRPTAFLPDFGEPQISVSVSLPPSTKIIETNEKVKTFEAYLNTAIPENELRTVQTIVGGGGANLQTLLFGGGGVTENIASITIGIQSSEALDTWAQTIRAEAEQIFGQDNVTVSAASISEQGFGGFALVLSGPQADLEAINQTVINTLNAIPGVTNASSNLAQVGAAASEGDAPTSYIRIDRESAVRFTAELETQNTLGVTNQAIEAIQALPDLPQGIKVSQGFESQLQTEGFQSIFLAMGIAIFIVVIILMITFGSLVHWLGIILSIAVAPVGAAIFLTLTNRVLGISAMIGLLMLIGIVVTNAVVLIDRVQANRRERGMTVYDALIEAGNRRLRPILMTAIATIFALMPLAVGLSKGAIIAAELGTVVIGGLISSTLLTLIVVPVAYSLLSPVHKRVMGIFNRGR